MERLVLRWMVPMGAQKETLMLSLPPCGGTVTQRRKVALYDPALHFGGYILEEHPSLYGSNLYDHFLAK